MPEYEQLVDTALQAAGRAREHTDPQRATAEALVSLSAAFAYMAASDRDRTHKEAEDRAREAGLCFSCRDDLVGGTCRGCGEQSSLLASD